MQKILVFKGKWRAYQERVLNELSVHITDKKLNVVAAPGAGKTTLGIEVIARINAPVLILAPTLTIRNQWIQRITEAFLTVPAKEVISTDVRAPKKITVITYQALLAAFCKTTEAAISSEEEEDCGAQDEDCKKNLFTRFNKTEADFIIDNLKKADIGILCFDEAHHLRKEWWKALDYLTANLKVKHTVSLTATPPYDVNPAEWKRYEDLCGTVDSLISIPELVQNGDLCPHQDFICFSRLRDNEKEKIDNFAEQVNLLASSLKNNKVLAQKLAESPFFAKPQESVETILDDAEFFISAASYLKAAGMEIPAGFLNIFETPARDIPDLNSYWTQKLLSGLFYKHTDKFPHAAEEIKELEKQAKAANAVIKRKVCLGENPLITRQISGSLGKLDSIAEIVKAESSSLGSKLRMVILADYIKLESLGKPVTPLGVIPIFETLQNTCGEDLNIAVLTGKIVIVPARIRAAFAEYLVRHNLKESNITIKPLEGCAGYIKILPTEAAKNIVVALITSLFNGGHINILIGTQALLGEGWDAPSINSLILSSTVSSYMLSNQMRGRAIRTEKGNPAKVANIWHLVSVKKINFLETLKSMAPGTKNRQEERCETDFTYDLSKAAQRFQCFEGPCYKPPYTIESGIDRLDLRIADVLEEKINLPNRRALSLAADRDATARAWRQALDGGYNMGALRQGLEFKEVKTKKQTLIFNATIKYTLVFYLTLAVILFNILARLIGLRALLVAVPIFFIAIARPLYIYLKTGSIAGSLKQVARCIVETLYSMDIVKSNLKTVGIHITEMEKGSYFFNITNVSVEENNIILKALREVLDPIVSPRYIIERRGMLLEFWHTKDYHAVPDIIAANKRHAEVFCSLWKRYVSPCALIYTRTVRGRKLLLKLRGKAFSSQFRRKEIRHLSKWG